MFCLAPSRRRGCWRRGAALRRAFTPAAPRALPRSSRIVAAFHRIRSYIAAYRERDEKVAAEGGRRLFKDNFDAVVEKEMAHVYNNCLTDTRTVAMYQEVPNKFWEKGGKRFQVGWGGMPLLARS